MIDFCKLSNNEIYDVTNVNIAHHNALVKLKAMKPIVSRLEMREAISRLECARLEELDKIFDRRENLE